MFVLFISIVVWTKDTYFDRLRLLPVVDPQQYENEENEQKSYITVYIYISRHILLCEMIILLVETLNLKKTILKRKYSRSD